MDILIASPGIKRCGNHRERRSGSAFPLVRSIVIACSLLLVSGKTTLASFIVAGSYTAGSSARSIAVADFNLDGIPDLAVGIYNSNSVSILLGKGDGTFQDAQSYSVDLNPRSVAVGDFNRDSYPDLAVADLNSDQVTILINAADWGGGPVPPP